jgi:hypothetical protein
VAKTSLDATLLPAALIAFTTKYATLPEVKVPLAVVTPGPVEAQNDVAWPEKFPQKMMYPRRADEPTTLGAVQLKLICPAVLVAKALKPVGASGNARTCPALLPSQHAKEYKWR